MHQCFWYYSQATQSKYYVIKQTFHLVCSVKATYLSDDPVPFTKHVHYLINFLIYNFTVHVYGTCIYVYANFNINDKMATVGWLLRGLYNKLLKHFQAQLLDMLVRLPVLSQHTSKCSNSHTKRACNFSAKCKVHGKKYIEFLLHVVTEEVVEINMLCRDIFFSLSTGKILLKTRTYSVRKACPDEIPDTNTVSFCLAIFQLQNLIICFLSTLR